MMPVALVALLKKPETRISAVKGIRTEFLRAELGPVALPTPAEVRVTRLESDDKMITAIAWFGAAALSKIEFRFAPLRPPVT